MKFEEFGSNVECSDNELTWNDEDEDDLSAGRQEGHQTNFNKRKAQQNAEDRSGKKFRRELKVAPPTAEEMIHLRETETLFKSNLFRLEIEEMLKEIKPLKSLQTAATVWIDSLRKLLDSQEQDEDWIHVRDRKWLKQAKICLPLADNSNNAYDGVYRRYVRPLDVKPIGSYYVDCTMGPKFNVDIAVTLPKSFFRKKDYLNQTYHVKRALYLCAIAKLLRKSDLVDIESELEFICPSGDSLKPVLVVRPRGKAAGKLNMLIHVLPEEGTFKLARFSPTHSNARKQWWLSNNMESESSATPLYNTSIAEDIVMESNERLRKEAFQLTDNMRDAVRLLRVWLTQRQLHQGFGAFTTYIMSMVLVYLKDKQKINKHMSSYQIIRNVWVYLSESDWTVDGASLCKEEPGTFPAISVFQGYYDVVFVDPSGYLNLTARMNKLNYLNVRSESALAVELLDSKEINGFQALFMVKMNFIHQFDHLICFSREDVVKSCVEENTLSASEMDYNGDTIVMFIKLVGDVLMRGLGQRASHIAIKLMEPLSWRVDTLRPPVPTMSDVLVFGIRLHPEHSLNIIHKGPQANLPQAVEFREFWKGKSELRRFKEGGMVCECVVWGDASSSLEMRLTLTRSVVNFLLEEKLNIPPSHYIYLADQLNHIITDKMSVVSPEQACLNVHKSLDELIGQLSGLEKLPLEVASVQCISPAYRYTDVFPPLPLSAKTTSCIFTPSGHRFPAKTQTPPSAPPYVPTIDLVIEMSLTRRWPDDLAACRRLTAAFYIAIGNKLHEKHNLKFLLSSDSLILQKDGLMFRLFLGYSKEISLLKLNITDDGVKQYRDTPQSLELEKKFISLPKMSGALHGLSVVETGLGGAVRLAKRWLSSHMFDSSHFPPILVELLVANLILTPQPYRTIIQPQQIFLRFLQTVATTNWHTQPVIINFNNIITGDEIREIERRFDKERSSLPPMFVVTPYDRTGCLWTRQVPTLSTLVRLAKLASASLTILEAKLLLTSDSTQQYTSIFSANLSLYDVVLQLDLKMVPRKSERVDWRTQGTKRASHKDKSQVTALPITGFDPPQLYLQYLRDHYDEFALFFYDCYGGSEIGVLFRPPTLHSSQFKVNAICGRFPRGSDTTSSRLITDFKSLISDFEEAGRGIVKNVRISNKIKAYLNR